jgi:hypothetical protein
MVTPIARTASVMFDCEDEKFVPHTFTALMPRGSFLNRFTPIPGSFPSCGERRTLKESGLHKNRGSCRKSFRICSGRENDYVCFWQKFVREARTTIVRRTTTVTEPVPPSRSAMTNLMVKGDFKPQAVRVCPSQKRLR